MAVLIGHILLRVAAVRPSFIVEGEASKQNGLAAWFGEGAVRVKRQPTRSRRRQQRWCERYGCCCRRSLRLAQQADLCARPACRLP